ncbi:MAG: HAD family phosphatase [Actinomycetota bacterium]
MVRTFDAVILDFDGTIVDTEWSEYQTVRDEYRRLGHDYPLESFQARVGRADGEHWSEGLVRAAGPQEDLEAIVARRRQAHADLIEATEVRAGIVELLDRADRRGTALAVASSSPSFWVEGHLERRGLLPRFQVVATKDLVERGKPWPDVFLAAADRLSIDPGRCLVVEDSPNGVAAAKAAGMTCVAVPNPITEGTDLSSADLVLNSLDELPWPEFDLG